MACFDTTGLRGVYVGFTAGIRSFIGARDGGAVAAVNRFFCGLSQYLFLLKLYHIDIIWYICADKSRVYGKGYTRAFDSPH